MSYPDNPDPNRTEPVSPPPPWTASQPWDQQTTPAQPGPSEPAQPWAPPPAPSAWAPPGPTPPGTTQPYPAEQYPGQQQAGQQFAGQQYPGQQDPTQPAAPGPYATQAYPTQPYQAEGYPGQSYPPQPYQAAPYPSQPYPGQPLAAPVKRMPVGVKILLWVLPVVVIVGLGALAFGLASDTKKGSATTATPVSSTSVSASASASSSGSTGGLDSFKLPKTVDGLPRSTDPTMLDVAKTMTDSLNSGIGGKTAAAIYQSTSNPTNILILVGLSHTMISSTAEIDEAFTGFTGSSAAKVKNKRSYPAGDMGGKMECADATLKESGTSLPIGVCMLADDGGMIMMLYFYHSASATAKAVTTVRPKFETQ